MGVEIEKPDHAATVLDHPLATARVRRPLLTDPEYWSAAVVMTRSRTIVWRSPRSVNTVLGRKQYNGYCNVQC
jgi:hypothetical protein